MAKHKKTGKVKKIILGIVITLLVISGLVLIFNEQIKSFIVNRISTTAMEKPIRENNNQKGDFDYDKVKAIDTKDVAKAATTSPADSIGKISIPDVGIKLPIFSGLAQNNLMRGAGTMKPDEQMGEVGNYALAGHHMEDNDILFGPLEKIELGDKVYVTNGEKVFTYKVTKKVTVNESQIQWINNIPNQKLITLVTCSSGQEGVKTRIIVRGELVQIQDANPKTMKIFSK